jgi:hypothetical protein
MTNIGHFRAAGKLLEKVEGSLPTRLWLSPPTKMDAHQLTEEGYYGIYGKAGARMEMPGCSLCMGNQARVEANSTVVSTSTRNFPNRLGDGANVYLASAELASVASILGRLPTVEEYMAYAKEIDTMASDVYRYLSFDQIAEFCGLHALEVQAIADGEVALGMHGIDPTAEGEVTREEIERCQLDPSTRLSSAKRAMPPLSNRQKGARYTPVSKRQDRPDAIAWLLKNYPELSDAQICKLIGTTKSTIASVRDRSHWNAPNIKQQSPVSLGLCSSAEVEKAIALARARAGTVHAAAEAKVAARKAANDRK